MLIEDRIHAERETRPQLIGLPSVDTSARRAGELADSRPVLPLERLEEISRESRGANERPEIDTFREVAACHTGQCATRGALATLSREHWRGTPRAEPLGIFVIELLDVRVQAPRDR